MDKKSVLIGILCIAGALILMTYNASQESKARQQQAMEQVRENEEALRSLQEPGSATPEGSTLSEPKDSIEPAFVADVASKPQLSPDSLAPTLAEEHILILENEVIRATLSSHGGAILRVALKDYPQQNPHVVDETTPVILNRQSKRPALSLNRSAGEALLPLVNSYTVESATPEKIVFSATLNESIRVRRTYTLESGDPEGPLPYTIRHQTEFINETDQLITLNPLFLNLGTAAPTEADYMGFNLNASYFDNGNYESIPAKKFQGGGFLVKRQPRERILESGIVQWGAVKNQFFTSIFTADSPAEAILAEGFRFPPDPSTGRIPIGITASMQFSVPSIQPGSVQLIAGDFYVGPKSFDRLSQMELKQEDVMQLGWFLGLFLGLISFVAKILLTLLGGIHGVVGNWGFAIIFTTIVIRLCLWPLTAKAARASKRMQKLQKPLKEIQEKYKDNPQKLNQEMMALWKKHKINPLSGCWPVLMQFPIFIAFFNLLRNSSDLRFAEFLWIHDLSMPDGTIPLGEQGLPLVGTAINVLPFVWLVSMYFQMKMMPQPSVDNAQAKIIKFMPFIFFPFTYYFSSGLVLYWTATNGFSIFQQWMTNRKRDAEDEAIETEIAEMEAKKTRKAPSGPLISKRKKKKKNPQ